jgi:hypothetical protein
MIHNHRVIPGYEGGEYVEGNVVPLSLTQHAMWHFAEWLRKQNIQDWVAYKMLSGQIGKEEGMRTLMSGGGKKGVKRERTQKEKDSISKKLTGGRRTAETRAKMRSSARSSGREVQSQVLRDLANSPHKPKAGRKAMLSRWGYKGSFTNEREYRTSLSDTFINYYTEFGLNG